MLSRRSAIIGSTAFAAHSALAGVQTIARHNPNSWTQAQINADAGYYDVVIYGATVAGIGAARAAVIMGAKTLLLEPTPYIGGASGPGGLTQSDCRWRDHTGGTWWQYMQRLMYRQAISSRIMPTTQFPSAIVDSDTWYPPIASLTYESLTWRTLYEFAFGTGADILCNAFLSTFGGAVLPAINMTGNKITSIDTAVGVIKGKVFIDASYEGDLLAGCASKGMAQYTIGREAGSQYGESLAGYIPSFPTTANGANFLDANSNPLYPLQFAPNAAPGSADSRVQSMTFRVPIGLASRNQVIPFYRPDNYNPGNFQLVTNLANALSYTQFSDVVTPVALNGGQYATNDGGTVYGFAPYNIGADYGDATPSRRQAIVAEIKAYVQGLFYYALTDPSMPPAVRADTALYGYLTENYTFGNYFPYQPYIREGRRMVNNFVLTQNDMLPNVTKPHSIGYATYVMDVHSCGAYSTADGTAFQLDAGFLFANFGPSQIPMEALFPRSSECQNLLVPVCAATSHIGWGPFRLEPTFMINGDACGIMAAAMAQQNKGSSNLNYPVDVVPGLTRIGAQFA